VALDSSTDSGARAYVGREPDGHRFSAYLTDRDESTVVEQGDVWQSLDEALDWARQRARRVVLTYGWSEDAVFTAGVDPVPGLPLWPPSDDRRRMIDEAVSRGLREVPRATPQRLGIDEPEIRAD